MKKGNNTELLDWDLQNVSRGHCWREGTTDCHGNNSKECKCDKFPYSQLHQRWWILKEIGGLWIYLELQGLKQVKSWRVFFCSFVLVLFFNRAVFYDHRYRILCKRTESWILQLKRIIHHDQVGSIPEVQGEFNIWWPMNALHHIDRKRTKKILSSQWTQK